MRPTDSVAVSPAHPGGPVSTRRWLAGAHPQLAPLLPDGGRSALVTEGLLDARGAPIDVFAHFGLRRNTMHQLVGNFKGLRLTALASSKDTHIETAPPAWPGFSDIWITINDRVKLAARIGFAQDGDRVRDATCIVIQPALFGDNGVLRTHDLAIALRSMGYHILALESRAHGQTEAMYPDIYNTWGVLESDDLMVVSDWLMTQPHVTRTGLMGFCWGANVALLAAWYDGHAPGDPSISPDVMPYFVSRPSATPRFEAGVMAFSPIIRWEEFMDALETPHTFLEDPVYAYVQHTIRERATRKGYPETGGSMRKLVEYEYRRYGVTLPRGTDEGTSFVRLLPYKGKPAGDKLERARVPVLIVHAADDPVGPAQEVAELLAATKNPLVAGLVLPSGGHCGFVAYAKAYYISLISNFFDPVRGAAGSSYSGARHNNERAQGDATGAGLRAAGGV